MDTIRQRTLQAIHTFAQRGGSVFAHPLHPQFAAEGSEKDDEIKKMIAGIIAKGSAGVMAQNTTPIHYLIRSRIPPLCHLTPASTKILCTTVSRESGQSYLLVNASSVEYSGVGVFRSSGRASIMDPATGKDQVVTSKKVGSEATQIGLSFKPFASLLVKFG
jgi:hypothetical protein